jgi:hypothetical protein
MPRRIVSSLVFLAAAAALAWAVWPGAPTNPATLINRVDVVVAVVMLAGLPRLARRVFGPAGDSWLARIVRVGGYAAVFALVLVKAEVERQEYAAHAAHAGRAWLAGAWTGEIVFLVVIAAYVAGLLAVTARRPPFSPVALAVGTAAGAVAGLLMYALPPVGRWPHISMGWLAGVYGVARGLAMPLALGTAVAAGLVAARRASRRQQLPLADARARQGVAAGLCAGAVAGLVFCVLSTGTVALLPHMVKPLLWVFSKPRPPVWTMRGGHLPHPSMYNAALYQFEMRVADTSAGYLLALVCFPLFGAGLGAWGGLFAAGNAGWRPGGGGGGGGGEPEPGPPPPDGGRRAADDRQPAFLRGYLHELPVSPGSAAPGDEPAAAPGHPERVPAGVP